MSIHREPPYRDVKWDRLLPESAALTDESIILPLFHSLTDQEQEFVIESIQEIDATAKR